MCGGGGSVPVGHPTGSEAGDVGATLFVDSSYKKKNITEVNIYIVLILLNHVYILYMGEVFFKLQELETHPFVYL